MPFFDISTSKTRLIAAGRPLIRGFATGSKVDIRFASGVCAGILGHLNNLVYSPQKTEITRSNTNLLRFSERMLAANRDVALKNLPLILRVSFEYSCLRECLRHEKRVFFESPHNPFYPELDSFSDRIRDVFVQTANHHGLQKEALACFYDYCGYHANLAPKLLGLIPRIIQDHPDLIRYATHTAINFMGSNNLMSEEKNDSLVVSLLVWMLESDKTAVIEEVKTFATNAKSPKKPLEALIENMDQVLGDAADVASVYTGILFSGKNKEAAAAVYGKLCNMDWKGGQIVELLLEKLKELSAGFDMDFVSSVLKKFEELEKDHFNSDVFSYLRFEYQLFLRDHKIPFRITLDRDRAVLSVWERAKRIGTEQTSAALRIAGYGSDFHPSLCWDKKFMEFLHFYEEVGMPGLERQVSPIRNIFSEEYFRGYLGRTVKLLKTFRQIGEQGLQQAADLIGIEYLRILAQKEPENVERILDYCAACGIEGLAFVPVNTFRALAAYGMNQKVIDGAFSERTVEYVQSRKVYELTVLARIKEDLDNFGSLDSDDQISLAQLRQNAAHSTQMAGELERYVKRVSNEISATVAGNERAAKKFISMGGRIYIDPQWFRGKQEILELVLEVMVPQLAIAPGSYFRDLSLFEPPVVMSAQNQILFARSAEKLKFLPPSKVDACFAEWTFGARLGDAVKYTVFPLLCLRPFNSHWHAKQYESGIGNIGLVAHGGGNITSPDGQDKKGMCYDRTDHLWGHTGHLDELPMIQLLASAQRDYEKYPDSALGKIFKKYVDGLLKIFRKYELTTDTFDRFLAGNRESGFYKERSPEIRLINENLVKRLSFRMDQVFEAKVFDPSRPRESGYGPRIEVDFEEYYHAVIALEAFKWSALAVKMREELSGLLKITISRIQKVSGSTP